MALGRMKRSENSSHCDDGPEFTVVASRNITQKEADDYIAKIKSQVWNRKLIFVQKFESYF